MREESYVRAVPDIQLALNRNRHGISLDLKYLTIRSEGLWHEREPGSNSNSAAHQL